MKCHNFTVRDATPEEKKELWGIGEKGSGWQNFIKYNNASNRQI